VIDFGLLESLLSRLISATSGSSNFSFRAFSCSCAAFPAVSAHSEFLDRGIKLAAGLVFGHDVSILEIADTALRPRHIIFTSAFFIRWPVGILFYTLVDHFWKSYWVDYGFGILFSIFDMLIYYFTYTGVNTVSGDRGYSSPRLVAAPPRHASDVAPIISRPSIPWPSSFLRRHGRQDALPQQEKLFSPSSFPTAWAKAHPLVRIEFAPHLYFPHAVFLRARHFNPFALWLPI
jgi:hypothetical protein